MRERLRRIAEEGFAQLARGTAMEAVVAAVRLLEDDPLFNAGTGSFLQEDGKARMSASLMDGERLRFSGVLNIERVRNPILVARALLEERDRLLAADAAGRYARSKGFRTWNPVTDERRLRWRAWQRQAGHGTVGAVALDAAGRLAAASSTGGKGFERVGRVSDSGLPAGNYADGWAAVSCTGIGEDIIEEGLAVRIAERRASGPLAGVIARTFRELRARGRRAGAIALDRTGKACWATTLPILAAVSLSPRGLKESF